MKKLAWRRLVTGAFLAGMGFLVLYLLAWHFPWMAVLPGAVFLPVGLWIGLGSDRPWLDGLVYGLLSALITTLILFGTSAPLQQWSLRFGLLLAIPQGLVGSWLGARLLKPPAQEQASSAAADEGMDSKPGA